MCNRNLTAEEAIPERGLAKGANYVWVDETGGELRALIIPEDPAGKVYRRGFAIVHENMGVGRRSARAQFRWNDVLRMEEIWIECDIGCCRVQGGGS